MLEDPVHTLSINIGDANVVLETGHLARNASGSVVVRHHKTVMLASVTVDWNTQDDQQFPVKTTVNHGCGRKIEKLFRREMRPSDSETLTCRLIDRSIRPLFPPGFNHPTTVSVTVFKATHSPISQVWAFGCADSCRVVRVTIRWTRRWRNGGSRRRSPDIPSNPAEVASSRFDLIMALGPDGLLMLEVAATVAHADISPWWKSRTHLRCSY